MDDRTTIAAMALQGLLAGNVAVPHGHGDPNRFLAGVAVGLADALLAELHPPQQEGGDPYEREKAAAAAIEDDRPF